MFESEPATLDDINRWVRELFVAGAEPTVPRLLFEPHSTAEVLLPGRMFRLPMADARDHSPLSLLVFVGLGRVGGRLWAQEVKTLIRLAGHRLPALPSIMDGGSVEVPDAEDERVLGWVLRTTTSGSLADPDLRQDWREDRPATIRQFVLLADALQKLHAAGLVHRNLWAGAIEHAPTTGLATAFSGESDDNRWHLRLARFEMTGLQVSLLRKRVRSEERDALAAQEDLLLQQGLEALAAIPPERLFEVDERAELETRPLDRIAGDVYGLGVVAFQLFIGDLDRKLIEAAFPLTETGRRAFHSSNWEELHGSLLRRISDSSWPAPFRRLIERTLARHPRNRATASDIVDDIAKHYHLLVSDDEGARQPLIVAVSGRDFHEARRWKWVKSELGSEKAEKEIAAHLQEDLKGAWLEYSPDGFPGPSNRPASDRRSCRYVLFGTKGIYFAHYFQFRAKRGGDGRTLRHALMIRFSFSRSSGNAKLYKRGRFRRLLPPVQIHAIKSRSLRPEREKDFTSWETITESVELEPRPEPEHILAHDALRWLLDIQRVELTARRYAFRRTGLKGGIATLEHDPLRDQRLRHKDGLLHEYCRDERRRPAFAVFFESLEDRGLTPSVRWYQDADGHPNLDPAQSGEGALVERWEGPTTIRVKAESGRPPPLTGWLEPADSFPERVQLARQARAAAEVTRRPFLIDCLLNPRGMVPPGVLFEGAGQEFSVEKTKHYIDGPKESPRHRRVKFEKTHPELAGDTAKATLDGLLTTTPIFAIQGPPGTGKTTLGSRAMRALLERDRGQRILVAAQSHYALDNLAEGILDAFEVEPTAVRVVSAASREKVHEALLPYLPEELAKRQIAIIKQSVARYLSRCDPRSPRAAVAREWEKIAPDYVDEVSDRLTRGANLVFATCATCVPKHVALWGEEERYDLVLVEEAAKAWPSELLMALRWADRWALIGDQFQLGAYRAREIEALLAACAESEDAQLREHGSRFVDYKKFFRLFEHLVPPRPAQGTPERVAWDRARNLRAERERRNPELKADFREHPHQVLDLQFRMRKPIGDLVSRAFYRGELKTHKSTERPHGLTQPDWLVRRPLLWLDTADEPGCEERPFWWNEGEVRVVDELLHSLRPGPFRGVSEAQRDHRLAVLSPYNAQVNRLATGLMDHPEARRRVYTVDSFQGREAEIVIVSMVRGRGAARRESSKYSRLGHLVSANRTNVLLSRAKRLLIIVGNFGHFEETAELILGDDPDGSGEGAFWFDVCESFLERDHPSQRAETGPLPGLRLPAWQFFGRPKPERPK